MPQYAGHTVSSLQSLLVRPFLLTGILREVLVRHFGDENNIELPELRDLVWQEDETTRILIETARRWRPELTNMRPGLLIRRNACTNQRMGIGNRLQMQPIDIFGAERYATFWSGSHTVFCLGNRISAQAELLASEVAREIGHFAPVLQRCLKMHRLAVTEIGGLAELEEAHQNLAVPVTVSYVYEETWVVRRESPVLRHVMLSNILNG